MLRKTIIAFAAAATLGVAALASTPAAARWGGWGFHHDFHRGSFVRNPFVVRHPFFFHRHFFAGPVLIDSDEYGCWRLRRVPTVWGWRWRRVWVCG